jgi:hypothetical protein
MAAILFSAATGGVSGWEIHFALLRAGAGKDLEDSFMSEVELSNQSQHAFWRDSSISNALIFVTADYAWGPSESHYSPHRCFISTYVLQSSELLDEPHYYLEDRYMTAQRYDLEGKADVLGSEKQEILARLKRVRQKPPTPR